MIAITAQPLGEAVKQISAKTPIGSRLKSADWADVPLALRMRAQFSAGVTSLRLLSAIQNRMEGRMKLAKEQLGNGKEAAFDRSSFIDEIRDIARQEGLDLLVDPKDRGTIRDITSIPRLGLIHDMQTAMSEGFHRWKADNSEGALLLFPAYRFTRVANRKEPRPPDFWPRRWIEAGGKMLGPNKDIMAALVNDPIWRKLSTFGTPWPPFDWRSGWGQKPMRRKQAVELGLLGEDEIIPPGTDGFNDDLEASVRGLDEKYRKFLKDAFGDSIKIEGDRVWWKGDRAGKKLAGASKSKKAKVEEAPVIEEQAPAWPEDPAKLQVVRRLGGSTGAQLVTDEAGNLYVRKQGASAEHLREEATADGLYQAMGVAVPDFQIYDGIRPTKLSRFIEGQSLKEFLAKASDAEKSKTLTELQQHFAVDALLANRDVIGLDLDNVLVDRAGKPWRIDNGGSLRFKAMGRQKEDWDEFPEDLWTLRDATKNAQTTQVFKDLDFFAIGRQIESIDEAALLAATPADLQDTLKARIGHLKDVGRKALDYEATGFVPLHADNITRHMVGLRKFGALEPMTDKLIPKHPGDVTPVDANGVPFDRLRTSKNSSGSSSSNDHFFTSILPAAKTINHHHSKGDTDYNQQKLALAAGQKYQLENLAKSGDADTKQMAAHYLKAIEAIEDAQHDVSKKVPVIKSFQNTPNQAGDSVVTLAANYMKSVGGDWAVISEWADAQAFSSSSGFSMGLKWWLMNRLRGITPAEFFNPPTKSSYDQVTKKWGEKFATSIEVLLALTQETLARIDMPSNDRGARLVRILRLEGQGVVRFQKGQKGVQLRGVNESGSLFYWAWTDERHKGPRTMTAVPHTRITSLYFFERRPGSNTSLLLGNGENEATFMSLGLETLHMGDRNVKIDTSNDHSTWPISR